MNAKIKVGTKLYVKPSLLANRQIGKNIREAIVERVGRKYFYARIDEMCGTEDDGTWKFDKTSGRAVGWATDWWRAYSSEQEIQDEKERIELQRKLGEFFRYGKTNSLTLSQLRAIRDIIWKSEMDTN